MMQGCRLVAQVAHFYRSLSVGKCNRWIDEFIHRINSDLVEFDGNPLHETGQMHPRMSALIHGWGKYPWMKNFHEWGAIYTRPVIME